MFKKYFLLVFIFSTFLFLNNKAFAFILDTGTSTACTSKLINATATRVVSMVDLKGNIDICLVPGSNPPFTILEKNNVSGFSTTTIVNYVSSTTTIPMPYVFDISSIQSNDTINFTVSDGSGSPPDSAKIIAYVPTVPITLTNNRSIAENGTINEGTSITFTCVDADELYFDPVSGSTNTPVVADYTGATNYTLVHTITPSAGNHTVECDNIGGSATRKVFHFYVNSNKLNIDNTSYSPTVALSPVHFTWSSNGTNCSFYNYDKSVKFGNASGNSGSGFSFDLTSPNLPQGANTYGYYIKCYDSNNPNTLIDDTNANLASSTEMISGVNTVVAWYHLVASFSCPNGYIVDSANQNACVLRPTPPICAFTDSTNQYISCSCSSGSPTSLTIFNTDGTSQNIVPPSSPFAWNILQYQYQLSCSGSPTLYPALQRPYTHFLSFNVSAGYIKPGGVLDMNWIVQDPTTTCKIVGVDLKTGQEIFNSEDSQYALVKNSVTKAKTASTSLKNFSDGSLKNIMNTGLKINSSARFTASCENLGTYLPGYYKLVRDVYTTSSQEK